MIVDLGLFLTKSLGPLRNIALQSLPQGKLQKAQPNEPLSL